MYFISFYFLPYYIKIHFWPLSSLILHKGIFDSRVLGYFFHEFVFFKHYLCSLLTWPAWIWNVAYQQQFLFLYLNVLFDCQVFKIKSYPTWAILIGFHIFKHIVKCVLSRTAKLNLNLIIRWAHENYISPFSVFSQFIKNQSRLIFVSILIFPNIKFFLIAAQNMRSSISRVNLL